MEDLSGIVSDIQLNTQSDVQSFTTKDGRHVTLDVRDASSLTVQERADIAEFHGTCAANMVTESTNYSFLLRLPELDWEPFVNEIRKHFNGSGMAHKVESGLLRFTLSRDSKS